MWLDVLEPNLLYTVFINDIIDIIPTKYYNVLNLINTVYNVSSSHLCAMESTNVFQEKILSLEESIHLPPNPREVYRILYDILLTNPKMTLPVKHGCGLKSPSFNIKQNKFGSERM